MDNARNWKERFENWPAEMPRGGILMTSFGEAVNFADFMTSETMFLAQRRAPDTMGARQIMVPYEMICGLKFTDVISDEPLKTLGFRRGKEAG